MHGPLVFAAALLAAPHSAWAAASPPPAAPPEAAAPATEMNSLAMLLGGIGLTMGGGVLLGLGGLFASFDSSPSVCVAAPCNRGSSGPSGATVAFLTSGSIAAAGGIALTVVGALPVEKEQAPAADGDAAWRSPTLIVGPTGGAIRWSF